MRVTMSFSFFFFVELPKPRVVRVFGVCVCVFICYMVMVTLEIRELPIKYRIWRASRVKLYSRVLAPLSDRGGDIYIYILEKLLSIQKTSVRGLRRWSDWQQRRSMHITNTFCIVMHCGFQFLVRFRQINVN